MRFRNYIFFLVKKMVQNIRNGSYGWHGNYINWYEAKKRCLGYDAINILERIKIATLKVKTGEAKYERDSIVFNKIEYSWPLLSALLWVSSIQKGKISVLDFGGSLGSSYFQNKRFLDAIENVQWNVVEQKNFVDCGQQLMEDDRLHFFNTIEEVIQVKGTPDIFMISCTLPYLENPYSFIKALFQYKISYLIIDNTPFNYIAKDRLTIQKVHPSIYEASYPCWLLDYDKVLSTVTQDYSLISEHNNDLYIYVDGRKIQYRGFLAKHKSLA